MQKKRYNNLGDGSNIWKFKELPDILLPLINQSRGSFKGSPKLIKLLLPFVLFFVFLNFL